MRNGVTFTEWLGLFIAEMALIVAGVQLIEKGFMFIGFLVFVTGLLVGFSWLQEER